MPDEPCLPLRKLKPTTLEDLQSHQVSLKLEIKKLRKELSAVQKILSQTNEDSQDQDVIQEDVKPRPPD